MRLVELAPLKRLADLGAAIDKGFGAVLDDLEAEGDKTRAGTARQLAASMAGVQEALHSAAGKFAAVAAGAAEVSAKELKKLLNAELGSITVELEDLAAKAGGAALAELQTAMEAMDKKLTDAAGAAKAAKSEQAAVTAVMGEATAAIKLLSSEMGALRCAVAAVGRGWDTALEALAAEVRAGNGKAAEALAEIKAALAEAGAKAVGSSPEELEAVLKASEGRVMKAMEAAVGKVGMESRAGLETMAAEMRSLFGGLKAGQEGALDDVMAALDDLHEHVSAVEAQAAALGSAQLRALGTLLGDHAGCPPLVAIAPKVSKAGLFAGVRRFGRGVVTLGSKHFKLMFMCSCCFRTSCGPNRRGFTVVYESELLQVAAPVFMLGLKAALVVAVVGAKLLTGLDTSLLP